MKRKSDKYADYVEHPRYGKSPRVTGLNPQTDGGDVFIHWHSPKDCRIPDTAIVADTTRQKAATVAVTHYYDVKRDAATVNGCLSSSLRNNAIGMKCLALVLIPIACDVPTVANPNNKQHAFANAMDPCLAEPDRSLTKETLDLIDCASNAN